jgi:hypothetical protein
MSEFTVISHNFFLKVLQTSFQSSLRSLKVYNHIHKSLVNNAFDWLLLVQGPVREFVYDPAREFQYELLNFTTKLRTEFATFREELCEIDCNTISLIY